MKTIYLISCVGQKLTFPCPAGQLYQSVWFKKAMAYAKSQKADDIYILSALYGLVRVNDVIAPYDLTLNSRSKAGRQAWALRTFYQIKHTEKVHNTRFVILAGGRYREHLFPMLAAAGADIWVPMAGLGIGEQLSWLKHNTPKEGD
jgi:hypothetical protein